MPTHREFVAQLDEPVIRAAIQAAEAHTTGQIRVFVSRHRVPDPLALAQKQFHRLGMHRTPGHNAVLIFLAPKSRTFALYGDTAVHARGGPGFWQTLRDQMTPHLKSQDYTAAVIHAITQTGQLLAQHFPAPTRPPPANELPDTIARD